MAVHSTQLPISFKLLHANFFHAGHCLTLQLKLPRNINIELMVSSIKGMNHGLKHCLKMCTLRPSGLIIEASVCGKKVKTLLLCHILPREE